MFDALTDRRRDSNRADITAGRCRTGRDSRRGLRPNNADARPGINKASIVMLAEIEGEASRAAIPAASEMRIPKAPHRILVYTKQFAVNADIHLTPGPI